VAVITPGVETMLCSVCGEHVSDGATHRHKMTTRDTPEAVLAAALDRCWRTFQGDYAPGDLGRLAAAILAALDGWTPVSTNSDSTIEHIEGQRAEIARLRRERDLLADAVCTVISRPTGRAGECPICRQSGPCEDQPAIELAAGLFAGVSEAELRAVSQDPKR